MDHHHRTVDEIVCSIITVSSSRTPKTDESGALIEKLLQDAGYQVSQRGVVSDRQESISTALDEALAGSTRLVILTGGTGISARDQTAEVVSSHLERALPGFGELFRNLSYQEIGARALLSSALAGVAGDSLVFVLPGSPEAVELGVTKLILPVAGHAIYELDKERK